MKNSISLLTFLILPIGLLFCACTGEGDAPTLYHTGTEFILAFLPSHPEGDTQYLYLVIMSEQPSTVTVEYPLKNPTFTETMEIGQAQMETVAIPTSASTGWQEQTPANNAVLVTATNDITVFIWNEKFALLDQALALPMNVLGQEYIVMSKAPTQQKGSEYITVATQDNTKISITPNTGAPINAMLNRGEGFLVASDQDLSGSIVTADKAVFVINGNRCANVPGGTSYCEHLCEVAVPVKYWKTEILARNLPRAEEGDGARKTYYRILASQNHTNIALNGQSLGSFNRGFALELTRSREQLANHFLADKPIFVVQYMNSICDEFPEHASCSDQGASVELAYFGDPTMTNLPTIEQYHTAYSFYRVVGGPQTGSQWLNIIALTEDVLNNQVLLDGAPIEPSSFTPFSTKPEFSHASLVIPDIGLHSTYAPQGHSATIVHLGWHMAFSSPAGMAFKE
jgi:hypothetical protein